jgi:hypothetical protein
MLRKNVAEALKSEYTITLNELLDLVVFDIQERAALVLAVLER